MQKYNPDKLATLISELKKSFDRLEVLGSIEKENFLHSPDKIDSVKYNFIVAIESAIDICNHIISQNGYRIPENYGDTFQVLEERGAFDIEFVKKLKIMARFRNRLVHIYWEVDDELVYSFLQNNLWDFKVFLERISKFLDLENI